MKIAFISAFFYPVKGGVESNVLYLAEEFVKLGHEVHVFTADRGAGEVFPREEVYHGIWIHRCRPLVRYRYYGVFYPGLLLRLMGVKDFDVIHVHSLGFFWHDICAMVYKMTRPMTKVVITPHGPFMALHYGRVKSFVKVVAELGIKLLLRGYDKVVEVNPLQKEWLGEQYGVPKRKLVYVPNGIPPEVLGKKEDARGTTRRMHTGGGVVLSYVGRLNPYKRVEDIVEVLARIRSKGKIVLMIMTSDQKNLPRLRERVQRLNVEKKVRFLVGLSEGEKFSVLQRADIFVMPSEWEAFSIAVLEAMAKKNAILSSRTEGGRFLVEEGKNGLLFDAGNTKQLEEKLHVLIENTRLRKQMQAANYEKAKQFVWPLIAQKMIKVYGGGR